MQLSERFKEKYYALPEAPGQRAEACLSFSKSEHAPAMRIISKKMLRQFWQAHPAARAPLEDWYRIVRNADWENLAQVREFYPHADLAGECTIFNIGGNKFRLIVKFKYRWKVVYLRFVLTHAEYDKGEYVDDCYR